MRVMMAKGRIDHEAEKILGQEMPGLKGRPPPYYFFSWIVLDLERGCRKRGWEVDTLLVGNPKQQSIRRPDMLINLISEPLACRRALDRLETIVQKHQFRVLNPVVAVRRSSRTALPQVLASIPKVLVPHTTKFLGKGSARNLRSHIEGKGHRWPVLIRPAGTHGSAGLLKFDGPDTLTDVECPASGLLVIDFVDFRSGDGLYRKYRMICVGGQMFRRHVIATGNWNVTGGARVDMAKRPDLVNAEKDFMSAGQGPLDRRIAQLFRIVGLDFGVIDFALSDAGEIIIFELNGTFQISGSIRPEYRERWGYLEGNNGAIVEALLALIVRRANAQPQPSAAPQVSHQR
jgi:hypothetical protein